MSDSEVVATLIDMMRERYYAKVIGLKRCRVEIVLQHLVHSDKYITINFWSDKILVFVSDHDMYYSYTEFEKIFEYVDEWVKKWQEHGFNLDMDMDV